MTPGEIIKQYRKSAKLSQAALAAELGITQGSISQMESNDLSINPAHVPLLVKRLQIPLTELLESLAVHDNVIPISTKGRSEEFRRKVCQMVADLYGGGIAA